MASSQALISLWVLITLFTALIGTSTAYKFYVGGREGWVLSPSENYNQWSGRMRFQVNDTLFFKYKNGENSVLVVNQGDFDNCNMQNPIRKLDGGDSVFMFDRSGPFYFISGFVDNCQKGQKLIVVVMAVRNKNPPPAPLIPAAPSPLPLAPVPDSGRPILAPSSSRGDNSSSTVPPPSRSAATAVLPSPSVAVVLFLMGAVKFGLF